MRRHEKQSTATIKSHEDNQIIETCYHEGKLGIMQKKVGLFLLGMKVSAFGCNIPYIWLT